MISTISGSFSQAAIEDPSAVTGTRATQTVFRALVAELESRIGYFIALVDNDRHTKETDHHAHR